MKESKLIEMRNKVESLGAALNKVIQELTNLRDLSIGTMQLVKKFPDYEKAIEKLKEELTKKEESKDGTV
jgi:predicted ATP-grasp superfamily ATP-dependent carboligase|tara:strand:+ start:875 stop:1084 length:210 start_codon:yes stop_codon:yes gene_type:complete